MSRMYIQQLSLCILYSLFVSKNQHFIFFLFGKGVMSFDSLLLSNLVLKQCEKKYLKKVILDKFVKIKNNFMRILNFV